MKKVIIALVAVIVVLVILLIGSNNKDTQQTNNNQQTQQTVQNVGRGFEDPEKLVEQILDCVAGDNAEEIVKYVPQVMIETIARENYDTVENVNYALLAEFQEETSWYRKRVRETFGDAGTFWSNEIFDYTWHESSYFDGDSLGIAGYDYYGLKSDGFESVRSYYTCIRTHKGFGSEPMECIFGIVVGKMNNQWYFICFD